MKTIILSNRHILLKQHIYGEDYYVETLMKLLKEKGNRVDVAVLFKDGVRVYRQGDFTLMKSIDNIVKNYDLIILHNVSPRKIVKAKIKYGIKVIMPIYLLWNKASPLPYNLLSRIGITIWQFIVDGYITPSSLIYRRLRLQGVFKKIYIIPPLYKCSYCIFEENVKKKFMLERKLPTHVKVVYIGSLDLRRLPLIKVIKRFVEDQSRVYEITIYTAENISKKVYNIRNVKVRIISKILSEEEKCRILRESHMFIAPQHGTTMVPSISIIEAAYHGNIIIKDNENVNFE